MSFIWVCGSLIILSFYITPHWRIIALGVGELLVWHMHGSCCGPTGAGQGTVQGALVWIFMALIAWSQAHNWRWIWTALRGIVVQNHCRWSLSCWKLLHFCGLGTMGWIRLTSTRQPPMLPNAYINRPGLAAIQQLGDNANLASSWEMQALL